MQILTVLFPYLQEKSKMIVIPQTSKCILFRPFVPFWHGIYSSFDWKELIDWAALCTPRQDTYHPNT